MAHKVRLAGCRVAALRARERLFQVGAGGFYRHGCLGLSITTSTYVRPCCMPTSLAASDNTLKRECGSKLPAFLTQHTLAILYEGDVWRQSIDLTVTREAGQGRSVTRPTNTTAGEGCEAGSCPSVAKLQSAVASVCFAFRTIKRSLWVCP
jgi:hypothetical protein